MQNGYSSKKIQQLENKSLIQGRKYCLKKSRWQKQRKYMHASKPFIFSLENQTQKIHTFEKSMHGHESHKLKHIIDNQRA